MIVGGSGQGKKVVWKSVTDSIIGPHAPVVANRKVGGKRTVAQSVNPVREQGEMRRGRVARR